MALFFDLLAAGAQYQGDAATSKAKRAWQKYSNTMLSLSNAMQQNSITTNQLLASDAFTNQAIQLKKEGIMTSAATEVAAAAAGVKGRSVNLAMRDVKRNAANREAERQEGFKNTMLAVSQQRQNASMSAAMQVDYSYIPKPKAATYFLNAIGKNMDSFN